MSKSVYNKLTDEVGGQKVPHSLHACKTVGRITNSDLTEINWMGTIMSLFRNFIKMTNFSLFPLFLPLTSVDV